MNNDIIVMSSYNNEEELDRQWNDWNQMTLMNRKRSNTMSVARYGKTNKEIYEYFKSEFNKNSPTNVNLDDPEVTNESSLDDRIKMIDIIEKELKSLDIKSGISDNGDWGKKNFLSGKSNSLFVCSINKEFKSKVLAIGKKELHNIGGRLTMENYNTIFLKTKKTNIIKEEAENNKIISSSYNPNITEDEAINQTGFYAPNGTWNNIMKLESDPNRLYRGRVECLIIRDNRVFLDKKYNNDYRLPGGSFELTNDNETQCYNECKEEARILIKNIKNTGIVYTKTYSAPAEWTKNLPIRWTGQYIEVYVADFDKYYNGIIPKEYIDEDIYLYGKFYKINDVYDILRKEHKQAIDKCVSNINIKENDTSISSNFENDTKQIDPLENIDEKMFDTAKEWSITNNIIIITTRFNIDDLERQYLQFMQMPHYYQKVSNQEAIRIFGCDNITLYSYLKHKLLENDKTYVKIEDIMNSDDHDSTSTISEFCVIENVSLDTKKSIGIIKEELLHPYDRVTVYNMLNELKYGNNSFIENNVINKFIKESINFINEDSFILNTNILPYFTPDEMDELGVFDDLPEGNYYNAESNYDCKKWFELYKGTGDPGSDWYSKVTDAYSNMVKNPSNKNKQTLLEYGWNPEISLDLDVLKKVNKNTKDKLSKIYDIEIVDISESLNDLDDYKEVAYIPKNINKYNLNMLMSNNINIENTNGRLFVDYNDKYVAHISIYKDTIVGIGSWYNGPELLNELIQWAIKNEKINKCMCNEDYLRLIKSLEINHFIATDIVDNIITFIYNNTNNETNHKESAEKALLYLKDIIKSEYSIYNNVFEFRMESDDGAYTFANWNMDRLENKDEKSIKTFSIDLKNIICKINEKLDINYKIRPIETISNVGFLCIDLIKNIITEDFLKNKYNEFIKNYKFTEEVEQDIKVFNNLISESSDTIGLNPVYIVTTYTGSPVGKAIKAFTHDAYSHASLGFDNTLEKLYSFNIAHSNGKNGGLSIESISQYIKDNINADINVLVVYLKDRDYINLKERLDIYSSNSEKTSYNFGNLFNIVINKANDSKDQLSMVCSQFVDSMLKAINIDLTSKPSNLVTPGDLSRVKNPKVYKVYEGKATEYNSKKINKKLYKLMGSAKPIKESIFIQNAMIGTYFAEPIFEAKEFPAGFDEDGSLLIKNYKAINYDIEYSRSNKLLKSYKANKNWYAMSYELCKLWFMNTVLLKKIEKSRTEDDKQKYIKIRAKIMNDFTIYLNEINKNVKDFNFSEYYERTPFNDTVIKISGSTLKYSTKLLKQIFI